MVTNLQDSRGIPDWGGGLRADSPFLKVGVPAAEVLQPAGKKSVSFVLGQCSEVTLQAAAGSGWPGQK